MYIIPTCKHCLNPRVSTFAQLFKIKFFTTEASTIYNNIIIKKYFTSII